MKADIQIIPIGGNTRNPAGEFVERFVLGDGESAEGIAVGFRGVDATGPYISAFPPSMTKFFRSQFAGTPSSVGRPEAIGPIYNGTLLILM